MSKEFCYSDAVYNPPDDYTGYGSDYYTDYGSDYYTDYGSDYGSDYYTGYGSDYETDYGSDYYTGYGYGGYDGGDGHGDGTGDHGDGTAGSGGDAGDHGEGRRNLDWQHDGIPAWRPYWWPINMVVPNWWDSEEEIDWRFLCVHQFNLHKLQIKRWRNPYDPMCPDDNDTSPPCSQEEDLRDPENTNSDM